MKKRIGNLNLAYSCSEANVFARHLLMPENEMEKILDKLFEDQKKGKWDINVNYQTVLNIVVENFGVPLEQAKIRLLEFGIPQ